MNPPRRPDYRCDLDRITRHVPICLREVHQWVCWQYLWRNERWTKVPVNPHTGGNADSTDRKTWGTFDEAAAGLSNFKHVAGIGFVFSADDPFAGIDLDRSIVPGTKTLKPWAQEIVNRVGSYIEISPSGEGVKIFLIGTKPGARCSTGYHDGKVEMYDAERFFTCTGNEHPASSSAVESRQEALNEAYDLVFDDRDDHPPTTVTSAPTPSNNGNARHIAAPVPSNGHPLLDDEQIIEIASRSRSGTKFKALWSGSWQDGFNSQSEADSSLVFSLAFYSKDAAQLDRMFRRSGLMREKWDEQHGAKTYGQMTIAKALAKVTKQYVPRRPARNARAEPTLVGDGEADQSGLVPLGEREPQSGRLVLSPKRTLPTAKAFIDQFHHHPDGRTLHSYAGSIWVWRGNRFVEIEVESLQQTLQPWLHDALRYQFNKQSQQMELVDFESNPGTIKAALESIRAFAHLPVLTTPPAWLNDKADAPDPRNLLPFPSGTLDLTTGKTLAPTPALFNINAIDFDYDPAPEAPERWIRFLEQLWGDDLESVELLQEWMGYCLVADTSQQKMLLMVGPKRSGKGTIGRVIMRLVGIGNVAGPTTTSLAGTFGLQPLIGKSLAIVSDARFNGENIPNVVERLLCISGEDTLTVDRKFLGSITMKLPTRFMFLTNELPRMSDASGALAGRFVILRLINSFYGQEDVTLTQQLMEELPGILVWAIEGLKRLRQRGYFVQPQAVSDAVQELEDLASPVGAFVRECCVVAPGARVLVDSLYQEWKHWCERDGRTIVTNKQTFGRDLAAAVPGVVRRRGAMDVPFYGGIGVKDGVQ